MSMTHSILSKDEKTQLHVKEDLQNGDLHITIDDENGEKTITLDFEGMYRFIGEMLHIQQVVKRFHNLQYPGER